MCNEIVELIKDVTISKDGCIDLSFQKGHLLRVWHRSQTVVLVQNECGVSFTLRLSKENKDWKYFQSNFLKYNYCYNRGVYEISNCYCIFSFCS